MPRYSACVGLRDLLRTGTPAPMIPPALLSPWAVSSDLSSIVWADLLDVDLLPLTRAEAMAVPAAARARHLLCGTVAGLPLRVYRGDVELVGTEAPTWTYRTDGVVSPWHRMLWTIDDLLWTGWSLWATTRDTDGTVVDAGRVPRELWAFDADGRTIRVDGEAVSSREVVLIPGPHEGLLTFAARTLRQASRLEAAATRHATNPVPSLALVQTVDVTLTETERDDLVAGWVAARASSSGAVGFAGYGIEPRPLGIVPEQLLESGRNAAAVDVARHASIPAAMLDATNAGASLTYETTQGRNGQYLDYGVSLYTGAVAARLSLDDVVARGSRVAFDFTDYAAPVPDTTGPTLED